MSMKWKAAVAGTVVGALALAGCGGGSAASGGKDTVNLVGFSILEQANKQVIADWNKTADGKGVSFQQSYGASGDQARAVIGGQKADIVHLSLEPDVQKLVDEKLVADDWKSTPSKGILTQSVVVIVVRKGNPKHIENWDDLVKPGVKIITPNPASSGSAKWNILAAWAHAKAKTGSDAGAQAFVTKLLHNAVALPGSGSDALSSFLAGNGDVLLAYENDSIEARASGEDVDYVIPDDTLLIQNPAAVTTDASPAAQDFLDFQLSKEGQTLYAQAGFRPVISGVDTDVPGVETPSDPFPKVKTLYTIDKNFGGWAAADPKYFDEDNGIITKIISGLNIGS
jgi:sulfate transport system substrate-binding protein